MRTPRPSTPRRSGDAHDTSSRRSLRGAATLIGTGTLPLSGPLAGGGAVRQGPVTPELGPLGAPFVPPAHWPDIRRASAMRKCMIFPLPPGVPPGVKPAPHAVSPAAMPPPVQKPRVQDIPVSRRRPEREARLLPAVSLDDVQAANRRALLAHERNKLLGKGGPEPRRWYEDPVALGTLLIVAPPIGLAALWSSRRYSNDARWALTLMTALTLCLGAVLVVVALRS